MDTEINYDDIDVTMGGPPPPQNSRMDVDAEIQQAANMARRINRRIGDEMVEDFTPEQPPPVSECGITGKLTSVVDRVVETVKGVLTKRTALLWIIIVGVFLVPRPTGSLSVLGDFMGSGDAPERALVRGTLATVIYVILSLYV